MYAWVTSDAEKLIWIAGSYSYIIILVRSHSYILKVYTVIRDNNNNDNDNSVRSQEAH